MQYLQIISWQNCHACNVCQWCVRISLETFVDFVFKNDFMEKKNEETFEIRKWKTTTMNLYMQNVFSCHSKLNSILYHLTEKHLICVQPQIKCVATEHDDDDRENFPFKR